MTLFCRHPSFQALGPGYKTPSRCSPAVPETEYQQVFHESKQPYQTFYSQTNFYQILALSLSHTQASECQLKNTIIRTSYLTSLPNSAHACPPRFNLLLVLPHQQSTSKRRTALGAPGSIKCWQYSTIGKKLKNTPRKKLRNNDCRNCCILDRRKAGRERSP